MCKDLGVPIHCEVSTDATAAKGIATRIGLGKVCHLETSQLWLQSKVADGTITINKIKGTEHRADALKLFLTGPCLTTHCNMLDVYRTNTKHHSSITTD